MQKSTTSDYRELGEAPQRYSKNPMAESWKKAVDWLQNWPPTVCIFEIFLGFDGLNSSEF
jgi:hypothetical protein